MCSLVGVSWTLNQFFFRLILFYFFHCSTLHTSMHTVLLLLLLYTTHIAMHICFVAIGAVHYTHSNAHYVFLLLVLYTTHIAMHTM